MAAYCVCITSISIRAILVLVSGPRCCPDPEAATAPPGWTKTLSLGDSIEFDFTTTKEVGEYSDGTQVTVTCDNDPTAVAVLLGQDGLDAANNVAICDGGTQQWRSGSSVIIEAEC